MNKKLIIIGVIVLALSVLLRLIFIGVKNIKIDEFHPAAVIFVVDSSASNQAMLESEKKYLKQLCALLDPEDAIKILRVAQNSYLIYEGSPQNTSGIRKALDEFTKYDDSEYGTAYGEGLKKAFSHVLNMKKEGYIPSVVVLGDLENEGAVDKQVNWDTLPDNVKKVQSFAPEMAMMFAFAHPEKLDFVKEKLTPVLGENKLIISPETNADKALRKFLEALGR